MNMIFSSNMDGGRRFLLSRKRETQEEPPKHTIQHSPFFHFAVLVSSSSTTFYLQMQKKKTHKENRYEVQTIPKKSRKWIKVKDDVVLISEELVKCWWWNKLYAGLDWLLMLQLQLLLVSWCHYDGSIRMLDQMPSSPLHFLWLLSSIRTTH